ncbi:MAG: hypothetical protein JJU37_08590 [Balneolaceae bacterium]|nr:hypothetical protein [Balneolaceae bacterium]
MNNFKLKNLCKLLILLSYICFFVGCEESFVKISSPDDGHELHGVDMMDDVTFQGVGWDNNEKSEIAGEDLKWYLMRNDLTERRLLGTGKEFTTNFTPSECGYNPLVVYLEAIVDGEVYQDSVRISQVYVC